ncbi:4666_t:CDS:2 [Gigaspora rosea]|nr:4666_t:CDS:2 [Gigaspora rosea]
MAKIAISFVNRYKLTPQTSLPQFSSYVEEDQAKRRFQKLGLSKEQADILIPIRSPERHVDERDPIKIIAQNIIKNNLSSEEINGIAYDLASSAPTTVAGNSRLNYYEKSCANIDQVMNHGIILTILGTVLVMQKAKRLIPDKFPFLLKDKNGNTNVVPLNQFLSRHRITPIYIKKIGADHASRVHGVEHYGIMNDRPNTPAPKQKNSEVKDIIDLYREISDDDS